MKACGESVSRKAHNLEIVGSTPASPNADVFASQLHEMSQQVFLSGSFCFLSCGGWALAAITSFGGRSSGLCRAVMRQTKTRRARRCVAVLTDTLYQPKRDCLFWGRGVLVIRSKTLWCLQLRF